MARILFVAPGFTRENIRLQPWRYVYELASQSTGRGNVVVLTNQHDGGQQTRQQWQEGFEVLATPLLSVRQQPVLADLIASLEPVELWWSTTPRSIAYLKLLSQFNCKRIAFMTCPLYSWRELFFGFRQRAPFCEIKDLLLQRLIPRWLFARAMNGELIDSIVVQSRANGDVLRGMGVEAGKIKHLPVGIDDDDMGAIDETVSASVSDRMGSGSGEVKILFLGSPRVIRGFDYLKETFISLYRQRQDVELVILARGASEQQSQKLQSEIENAAGQGAVQIESGWLSRDEVWAYLAEADIVVLPFLLVPSDVPVAALEAMARGSTLVVSTVDGLPELVADGRGVAVDLSQHDSLRKVLLELVSDPERRRICGEKARAYMQTYPRWQDVGRQLEEVVANVG